MDDEYQGMERFGMENDFEGGQWIDGEFYYHRYKEHAPQTHDNAIYGTFTAGSSDSYFDGGGGRRLRKRRRDDLISKPIHFVSTGIVMPSQEIDRNLEEDARNPPAKNPNLSQGLCYGLGFRANSKERENDADDVEEEGDDNFLPMAFGRKIKEGAQRRHKEKEIEREREREGSKSMRKSFGRRDVTGEEIGKFESHTKDIGIKLLKMMGYKDGSGLGKNM